MLLSFIVILIDNSELLGNQGKDQSKVYKGSKIFLNHELRTVLTYIHLYFLLNCMVRYSSKANAVHWWPQNIIIQVD